MSKISAISIATTTSARNCTKMTGASSTSSADRIRSKFLHKIGIDSPHHLTIKTSLSNASISSWNRELLPGGSVPGSSVGDCILRLEPLKIGLESDDDDDDSSVGSCDEESSDHTIHGTSESIANESMRIGYFHKKPHGLLANESSSSDHSVHSLPNLIGSDDSTVSGSVDSNASGSVVSTMSGSVPTSLSSSISPNKKARFCRDAPRRKKKSVSIHKSVSVVTIPSRLEYSSRIRERIWSSSIEIQANAARNTIEFCSESWDWKKVLEDEQMFIHQANGQLIHPIHVHNALACVQASTEENQEEARLNLNLISFLVPNRPRAVTTPAATSDETITDQAKPALAAA